MDFKVLFCENSFSVKYDVNILKCLYWEGFFKKGI